MSKKYRRAFKKGFIIGTVIVLLLILIPAIIIFPKYSEYTAEAKQAIEEMGEEVFYSSLTGYIYDDSGTVIKKMKTDKDTTYLKYEETPEDVINAFIAVEDRTFWSNAGVDIKGVIRVMFNYVKTKGEVKHGASTITQQLVRNVYISSEVTIERKVKEMCYALELNKHYTKKQIMEYYINNIYYSNGYYGIEAAAKGYFNKTSAELSLSQMVYLCAVPNSPTYYDPVKNPDNALKRRNKMLGDMLELNYISQSEYDEAIAENIIIDTSTKVESDSYGASYALDCATRYLMKAEGFEFRHQFESTDDYKAYLSSYNERYDEVRNELYTGGYGIYTSLNAGKQEVLQGAIDSALSFEEGAGENGVYNLQASATCIDNETNKVVAIIGGRSQEDVATYLNRAYQSYRQPGSAIKPLIVYTPALELGYNPDSVITNVDVDLWKKTGEAAGSPIVLREAVESSKNGAAWGLFLEITPRTGLSYLQNMKFAKIVPDDYYASASLGGLTYGVTTVEMASAYNALVNEGVYTDPTCITSILDKDGNELYSEGATVRAYIENAAIGMIDILKGVITNGTAKGSGWSSQTQAAGKTGTTNDNKDGWFCGVTPYYSMSVWVGYDNSQSLQGLYGSSYPLKIWTSAMSEYVSELPAKSFTGEFEESEEDLSNYDDVSDNDFAVAEQIQETIDNMYAINKADSNWPAYADSMYSNAMIKVSQIASDVLRDEMSQKVTEAYNEVCQ